MSQTYRIPVVGDFQAKLEYARQQAAKQGVTLVGDTRSGRFAGSIVGTYEISGGVATVTITSKPFFISWDYVGQQLRAFLGG